MTVPAQKPPFWAVDHIGWAEYDRKGRWVPREGAFTFWLGQDCPTLQKPLAAPPRPAMDVSLIRALIRGIWSR